MLLSPYEIQNTRQRPLELVAAAGGDEEVRDGDDLQVVHGVVSQGHVLEVRPGVHQELDGGEVGGRAAGAVYHGHGGETQLLQQRFRQLARF